MPIGTPLLFVFFCSQLPEKQVDVLVEGERLEDSSSVEVPSYTQTEVQLRTRPEVSTDAVKALEMVPAAVVTQGASGMASVSLLGAPSQDTLVVSDGMVLNDPSQSSGGFDFSLLHVDPMSELVVMPGPASVVYRNGGLGGVIEIRPAPLKKEFVFAGKLEAGFERSKTFSVAGGYAGETSQMNAWAGLSEFSGQSAASSWRGNHEDDVQLTSQGRLAYSHKLSSRASVDASIRYVLRQADLDDWQHTDDPNYTSRTQLVHSHVRGRYLVNESYRQTLTLALAQTKRLLDDDEDAAHQGQSARYEYTGQTQSADWLHEVVLSDALTLKSGLGLALEAMKADEESAFGESQTHEALDKKRLPVWLYTELEHSFFEKQSGRVGVRIETLKEATTKSLSAFESIPTNRDLAVEMSVGYNERVPTFYQLYSSYDNDELQTERAVAGMLGVIKKLPSASFSLQTFVTEFRNLVDYDTDKNSFRNIGRAETYGASAELRSKLGNGISTFQYRYLKAIDLTAHKKMNLRPRHRVNIRLETDDSLSLGTYLMMRYTSSQNDFGDKTLASLYLWELGANYRLSEEISFYGRIENLSDVRYETSYGYAGEPRTLYLGATAQL